jgi:hypothetical protein
MGLNLDLRIGTSRAWELQVLNPDDSVPTGQFLSTDVLTASVWQGRSTAPVISKSGTAVAWLNATDAQFVIYFYPADTANLPAGVYYVDATATRGSNNADLLPKGTTLTLLATPGNTPLRPTYITVLDIQRIAPWVADVQAPGSETGFLDQCADSRDWLDENVLRNYRGGNVELLGYHGLALDSWYTGGTRRTSLRNPWILSLLQTGPASAGVAGLIVTTRTKDICAYYALHRICEGMVMRGSQYPALSARALHKAQQLLACYTAELSVAGDLDTFGNVLANIPINFSSTNTLYT